MDTQIVIVSDDQVDVVTDQGQGPPGPPGVAGTTGALSYTAATALGGHVAVVLDASGLARVADATIPSHQFVEAISIGAAGAGDVIVVIKTGIVEHLGWTFVVGAPVFLGLAGAITQVIPPQAVFMKVLGVAVSPTRVKVDFQAAIFL